MPNAAVLFASPHENGATKKLLARFLQSLGAGWHVESFDVCAAPVQPCVACGVCRERDGCAFSDLDALDAALKCADLIVVASPVWNLSFPAQCKAVLDRFQRYYEARFARNERFPGTVKRPAALLLTMGKDDPFAEAVCRKTLAQCLSVLNAYLTGVVCLKNTDDGVSETDGAFEKASALALEITAHI